jgi:hypothetical protein
MTTGTHWTCKGKDVATKKQKYETAPLQRVVSKRSFLFLAALLAALLFQ